MKIGSEPIKFNNPGASSLKGKAVIKQEAHTVEDSVVINSRASSKEKITTEKKIVEVKADTVKNDGEKEDYHFKPPYPVEEKNGKWFMKLPNATIPCPRKPAWLESIDRLNTILDESPNPVFLKTSADKIKKIADGSYDSGNTRFAPEKLNEFIGTIKDAESLNNLKRIFQIRLDDETQSTHQVGGTLAGSLCSEMAKYGNIMSALENRLGELS